MSMYKYECVIERKTVCNDDSVFPAMRDLVEKEGMTVRAAAKFVEDDSGGQVTLNRAKGVYLRRSGSANRPLKRRNTVDVENVNVFVRWNAAMNKCLDFGSKILNGEVSWESEKEKRVIRDCLGSVDEFSKLCAKKVKRKRLIFKGE